MEKPKSTLNPDAAPFIPRFTNQQSPPVNAEKSPDPPKARIPDLDVDEEGFDVSVAFLSTIFPNFSEESIAEVFQACGDVFEAERLLKQLEGTESSSESSESSHSQPLEGSSEAASSSHSKPSGEASLSK